MIDSTVPIEERIAIWGGVDSIQQGLRPRVYDRIANRLQLQYEKNPLSKIRTFDEAFPEPPGLEAWRQQLSNEAAKAKEDAENNAINSVERK